MSHCSHVRTHTHTLHTHNVNSGHPALTQQQLVMILYDITYL